MRMSEIDVKLETDNGDVKPGARSRQNEHAAVKRTHIELSCTHARDKISMQSWSSNY